MNLLALSWAYLKDRPLNTALNILLLAIGAATVAVLLLFSNQLSERMSRDAQGIDLVVGAKGSPLQLILSSIYHVDIPTGNIPLPEAERLERHPQVRQAVPLALGDSFRGFRIVGTAPAYTDLYDAKPAKGRLWAAVREATVGAEVARRLGMDVGQQFVSSHGIGGDPDRTHAHEDTPYRVVGILKPTGTVLDRLILTSVESVWEAHGIRAEEGHDHDHDHDAEEGHDHDHGEGEAHAEEHEHDQDEHAHDHDHDYDEHDHQEGEDHAQGAGAGQGGAGEAEPVGADRREITALLIRYRSPLGAVQLPRQINQDSNLQAAVPAVQTARLLSLVGVGLDAVRGFAVLLMITAGLGVFVALSTAMAQRRYDVAMLRTMGASRDTVLAQVVLEGVLLAGVGALAGLLLGHLAVGLAAATVPQLGDMGLTGATLLSEEIWIVIGALIIGAVAALIPAWQAYRVDIADTLAQGAG